MAGLLDYLMAKGAAPAPDTEMPSGLPVSGGAGSPLMDAFLQLQYDRLKDAVTAPRDAYSGDLQVYDPTTGHITDEAMSRAGGMAGLAMTGSLPMSRPAGSLGTFAGRLSKTADHDALARAESMLASGADRQAVWDQTGWFRGADGQMRYEIPDAGSRMPPRASEALEAAKVGETITAPAARTLMHPDYYAAYPDVRQMPVDVTKGGGYPYQPSAEYRTHVSGKDSIGVNGRTTDEVRDLALHEMQHAVQARESFALGGNPDRATGLSREAQFAAAKKAYQSSADDNALLRELGIDAPDVALKPWEELTPRQQVEWLERGRGYNYHHSAGEVEARNVQTRRDMTPEQLRARPPWLTQDVSDADQIVNLGMRLSR